MITVLAIPEVQALIATLAAYLWLTHVQAALPPWLLDRVPAPLRTLLQALAGNWGNAANTQAPIGPASPLAALAVTAICAVVALGPAFLARQPAAASPLAPAVTAVNLPADPTVAALSVAVSPSADITP